MRLALESWPLRAVATEGLMSRRGVGPITAVTVLGDISRFDNARQLMSFCGAGSRGTFLRVQSVVRPALRKPAMRMSDGCWWKPLGVIASRLAKPRCCGAVRNARFASCTGHRLEGAETAVQPLSTLEPRRQGKMQSDHGRSP